MKMPPKKATPTAGSTSAAKKAPAVKSTTTKTGAKPASDKSPAKSTKTNKPGNKNLGAKEKANTPHKQIPPPAEDQAKKDAREMTAAESGKAEASQKGTTIGLKEISTFLFTPENDLGKSGRWALVTDLSERSTTFLRYRDVNMLNAVHKADMELDRIRRGVLGALRFGKPLVIDFMTTDLADLWPLMVDSFNAVKPGLVDAIMDRSIMKEEYFRTLVTDDDDEATYGPRYFYEEHTKNFSFIIMTARAEIPTDMRRQFFVVHVV